MLNGLQDIQTWSIISIEVNKADRHKKGSFLTQGLKNLKTVGTFTRSSSYLCKEIVRQIKWTDGQIILELGAGDGVITKFLLDKMGPHSKLIAFEINEVFLETLKGIKDDRLIVISQDASQIQSVLKDLGYMELDHVVSAIPFVILPQQAAMQIIQTCYDVMVLEGKFIQVHYSLLAKKLYERIFGAVEIKFVPCNIPPAVLLIMRKSLVNLSSTTVA